MSGERGPATLRFPSPRIACCSAMCWVRMRVAGIRVGSVRCDGRSPILYTRGQVKIGEGLSMRGRTARVELGAARSGVLTLGARVYLNQGATVVASDSILIGDRVRIGDHAAIHDSDYHAVSADVALRVAPIVIGDDVWIGRNAIVMPGVGIGAGTVVAAGAVVTHSLPARCLAAGVPARVIRELDVPEGWQRA